MTIRERLQTLVPVAATLAALAALAAPIVPMATEALAGAGANGDETTVTIRAGHDAEPVVLKMPDLRPGETRSVTSASGKDVTVTRTDTGYRIRAGEKDVEVRTDGQAGGEAEKVIVLRHGNESGHPVRKVVVLGGGGPGAGDCLHGKPTGKELLEEGRPSALSNADVVTQETVAKVLDELLARGAIVAPPKGLMVFHAGQGTNGGDTVEVQVERKVVKDAPR